MHLARMRNPNASNGGLKWSAEEDAAIREDYPKLDGRDILKGLFPWRTHDAFYKRACKLGVKGPHRGGHKAAHIPHDCKYCGKLIPINGMTGYSYNRKLTCSRPCALALGHKSKIEHGTLVSKNRIHESPELIAALAARDRGDHSMLEAILNG